MPSAAGDKKKQRGKPFAFGNPGRPPGSQNATTKLIKSTVDAEVKEKLIKKGLELALGGDATLLRFFLDRIVPKEQPVSIDLPVIKTHKDVADAQSKIIASLSAGHISAGQANDLTAMVSHMNGCLDDAEIEGVVDGDAKIVGGLQKAITGDKNWR